MLTSVENLARGIDAAKKHMATFDGWEQIMHAIKELTWQGINYTDMLKITVGYEEYELMRYFLSMYENLYRFIEE